MWRILQISEVVIHLGLRPRWITTSEICRILHILRKLNSIIALSFIQNIFFAQTFKLYSRPFLQRIALLTSLVQYDRILGQQQLFMVNYACVFNQLETGKYFEWIISFIMILLKIAEYFAICNIAFNRCVHFYVHEQSRQM